MRTDPPTGDDFDRIIGRITDAVMAEAIVTPQDAALLPGPATEAAARPATTAGSAGSATAPGPATTAVPRPTDVPRRRVGLRAAVVVVLVLLGVGTAGTALALGLGTSLWNVGAPIATATPSDTPSPSSTPTAPASSAPPAPSVPAVTTSPQTFTAPSWGSGVTADVSGLAPNTRYAVSIESRYRGESSTPDGYFPVLSSPAPLTTDGSGRASITFTPDTFPQNFTHSGESGFLLGSYLRVDAGDGPAPESPSDGSTTGIAEPVALSEPLSIAFLPIDDVTADVQACVEPEQLVAGQAGLPVTFSGLLPGEWVELRGVQTDGGTGYSFDGRGAADDSGHATIIMNGNTAEYPVAPSSAIAPSVWQIAWSANFRVTPPDGQYDGTLPVTIGGCAAG
ncbi:hypothetical protein [Subtercola sp. YIM 133946]|uniref:hypothetical protein n=1 Tax=Subtercola sp. YIM 133946 TaxID=3118909 RepID=UPI002F93BA29